MRCPGCGQALAAGAGKCPHCGARQHAAGASGERKHVTVMFADVKGSMNLSGALDVEQWWSIMEHFFPLLSQGVERFDGRVERFTGDGMMAVFGAPSALEHHANRACHAALHLRDQLARYAEELRGEHGLEFEVRIGLNSGEVVAGTLGLESSAEYTAIGHTAGLAQRMESLADPGGILLTEATARLVRGYFLLHERGEMLVKGVETPMRVFALVGTQGARTPFEMSVARGLSRFVGRSREMTLLDDAFARALAGQGSVVSVVGEAGVGKTRLSHEFLERCQGAAAQVWKAHAFDHLRAAPFAPILELLRDFFDIAQSDDPADARAKVTARLAVGDHDLPDALPLVLEFLGVSDPAEPQPHLDPEARRRRLFMILTQLLCSGRDTPAVILLEDLHWIDPASAAFVEALLPAVQGTRTMLITTSRESVDALGDGARATELHLEPLPRSESELLLETLLGSDPSLDGVAGLVYSHAEGNPFFSEEIVRTLVEAGALRGVPGGYRLTRTIDEIEIPASVQSVLAARIDRLDQRGKSVLQAASVIGRAFSATVLGRVTGVKDETLDEVLRDLEAAAMIAPQGSGRYAFNHALAERVAYRSQLLATRAETHAAVAEALEEASPDRLPELSALIANHWARAGEAMRAAEWSARAAGWAGFNDPREALRQWRRARELVDAAPPSADRDQLALGTRVMMLNLAWRLGVPEGSTREQFERDTAALHQEAVELAQVSGNHVAHAVSFAAYGAVRGLSGQPEEMASLGGRALELAEEVDDHPLMLTVLPSAVYGLHGSGRFHEVIELLDAMSASFPEHPEEVIGVTMVCPYAWLLCYQAAARAHAGDLRWAFAAFERALDVATARADAETANQIHFSTVQAMQLAGGGDALAHAEHAQGIAERSGGASLLGHAWRYLAIAHVIGEEWDSAIEAVNKALATWRPRQVGLEAEPHALTMRARAELGRGDPESACVTAQEAVTLAMQRHTRSHEFEARIALVEALRRSSGRSAAPAADVHIRRAHVLLSETGARTLAGRVHVEIAELARLRGDEGAYEAEIARAHELFVEVGALPLAERTATRARDAA